MNFEFDNNLQTFREEVRDFVSTNLPPDIAWRVQHNGYLGLHEERLAWAKILSKRGWSVPHWPVEHGGTNWSAMYHHVFNEECMKAHAPKPSVQGPYLVAPAIIAVGTEEQKDLFLPAIRGGDHLWCQGFSEPNAGSDLASLRTTATLEGDHYVVNGQKVWTSGAHHADWGFFLVRTSKEERKQQGLTFLLIDMRSPGVTVRPVITIDGEHHTNECFLENVHVPVDNLLGKPGHGWTYAKTLLGHERAASAEIYWSRKWLEAIKQIASQEMLGELPVIANPVHRHKLARLELELRALEYSVLRVLSNEKTNVAHAAINSSLKVRGSELMQRITDVGIEVLGPRALRYFEPGLALHELPDADTWPDYILGKTAAQLALRAATVFGGAREIQKNIIAKTAFGL